MQARILGAATVFTALVALTSPAAAQSASTTGAGSITIVRPLTITKTSDMKFGTVTRPTTGSGTVTLSNAGARSVSGGITALAAGDTPTAAAFNISGEGGQSISVTIPTSFTMANGADNLTVNTTNDLIGSAAAQTLSNAAGAAGTLAFAVGGSVAISSTQASGAYTGSFTVSAAYN